MQLLTCVISSFVTLPFGESRPEGPERGARLGDDHSRAALPGRYRVRPSRAREGEVDVRWIVKRKSCTASGELGNRGLTPSG